MNKILDELLQVDYASKINKIKHFLSRATIVNNLHGLVFGLSGGLDSTIIAYLCSIVNRQNTLVLIMPDPEVTPIQETKDAITIANKLKLNYKVINISLIVDTYMKHVGTHDHALGNLRSRIRSNILYYYSNMKNYLVVGTTDKSEYLLGYFTKFGDGGADALPLVSLYKTQLKKFAKQLQISERIINKKSSPHILKNQLAENDIGLTYNKIDVILYCLFDKKLSLHETSKLTSFDINSINKIFYMYKKNRHKRKNSLRPC
ncbi:MAG: NAD+ synthase [Thaumarchaeota archaeon]|nr:NAD+ synthase [Nitrososphaerota archaeon]MCY3975547.1 NAD+ synthase [Nitrososphaerota archaeon]